jgi:hypothetical protein
VIVTVEGGAKRIRAGKRAEDRSFAITGRIPAEQNRHSFFHNLYASTWLLLDSSRKTSSSARTATSVPVCSFQLPLLGSR